MPRSPSILPGQIVVAVDGGGTKTACRIAYVLEGGQREVLANGQAGPSNPRAVGVEQAAKAIQAAVRAAAQAGRIEASEFEHGLFSIAGTFDAKVRGALTERLTALKLATNLVVIPDLYPLLDSKSNRPSFGLIAGTGSVAIGRNMRGQLAIAGGWGHVLGDEGSGFAIGKDGLRHTLQMLETTGAPHGLAAVICELWGVHTAYELKTRLASFTDLKAEVAQLAKVIVEQAQKSDMTAVGIVLKAAEDLARLVQQLRVRLDITESAIGVRVSGGLFSNDGFFLDVLKQALKRAGMQPNLQVLSDPTHSVLEMLISGFQPKQYHLLP
ncbi:BadF/BadG/BcrA/BcrD ATPase family protein [Blastopirellula marina]|uniref:ATPase BadF/BadG/BcrA/BcrD type domain-containing protein n=1 Tax=Blastopirellula marina TaxID=124 RepID=A0A2S8GBR9_9BACT|nr:BadF/BadG/BcrA/BcrD ATPase family protein [Blastopirellula marina]PQO41873.1 hypothetical protein C5Y98_02225 [Blastopirellula marina]PTL46231.1 hypothetical protein C5Y97_02225 [Blastopirellula marina]